MESTRSDVVAKLSLNDVCLPDIILAPVGFGMKSPTVKTHESPPAMHSAPVPLELATSYDHKRPEVGKRLSEFFKRSYDWLSISVAYTTGKLNTLGYISETVDPRCLRIRVWNGLDQSAGFIIHSSPGGFGLDWIRNSPPQRILDWTGSRNVQSVSHI